MKRNFTVLLTILICSVTACQSGQKKNRNMDQETKLNDQSLRLANGETIIATEDIAQSIYDSLLENKYIKKGELTDKFYEIGRAHV